MSKRFCLGTAGLITFVAACAAAMPACSGSSDTSGEGGSGGVMMEAGSKETSPDTSLQDNVVPDISSPDVSQDVSQEPDGAKLDAETLEGSLYDLTLPDVMIGDTGASLQGCYGCAVDSCPSELAACEADPKCRTLVLCMFVDNCFDANSQMGVDQGCAMGCYSKSGLSTSDPALGLGLSFAKCVGGQCQSKCGVPDGGLPFDSGPDVEPADVVVEDVNLQDHVEQDVKQDIDYTDVIPPNDSGPAPDAPAAD